MKLISLEIKNFRQYYGNIKIKFNEDPKKNFNIIRGVNGAGKTNLMNAITWCLYKNEDNINKSKTMPIINSKALEETGIGNQVETFVRLVVGNEDPQYIFERKIVADVTEKISKNVVATSYGPVPENIQPQPKFTVMSLKLGGKDWLEHSQPEYLINSLLPENVHSFFIFDGESLDELFKAESKTKIKESIRQVSQIELLDKAANRLDSVRNSLLRESRGMNPDVDRITRQIENEKNEYEKLQIKMSSLANEITANQSKLENLKDILRQNPVEPVQNLQKQEDDLTRAIDFAQKQLEELKNKKTNHILKWAPYAYLEEIVGTTLGLIQKKSDDGAIPSKIRRVLLDEIFSRGICICGSSITSGDIRKHLEEIKANVAISEIEDELLEGKMMYLRPMRDTMQENFTTLLELGRNIKDIQNEQLLPFSEQLKEIKLKKQKIEDGDLLKVAAQESELEEFLKELAIKRSLLQRDMNDKDTVIKNLEKEYRMESGKNAKFKDINQKMEICQKSYDALTQIAHELMHEFREEIEEKTSKYFLDLIWKKDAYTKVKVDDNFEFSVIHKEGYNAIGALSAGERQVLALAFMAALKDSSGFEFPVIIDTPLGRISGAPRENIAENLPKYLKNTQVTMLVTDTEYTSNVRQKLLPCIGKEYDLHFEGTTTEIKPYVD
jgi:DNA sulfur modification protein DndD